MRASLYILWILQAACASAAIHAGCQAAIKPQQIALPEAQSSDADGMLIAAFTMADGLDPEVRTVVISRHLHFLSNLIEIGKQCRYRVDRWHYDAITELSFLFTGHTLAGDTGRDRLKHIHERLPEFNEAYRRLQAKWSKQMGLGTDLYNKTLARIQSEIKLHCYDLIDLCGMGGVIDESVLERCLESLTIDALMDIEKKAPVLFGFLSRAEAVISAGFSPLKSDSEQLAGNGAPAAEAKLVRCIEGLCRAFHGLHAALDPKSANFKQILALCQAFAQKLVLKYERPYRTSALASSYAQEIVKKMISAASAELFRASVDIFFMALRIERKQGVLSRLDGIPSYESVNPAVMA
ncbi:hypothetical protein PAPHI01_2271 [Pancytospora philotis]|nr:hypothetical protein PAPHI01_2271 [Pancytospora philotis]